MTPRRMLSLVPALALASVLTACGGSDSLGPGGGGLGDPGNGGFVPDELVGSWSYGTISPTNFWNDHTGQYSGNAYGIGAWFTFKPNGTYEQFVYIYTQQYSCRTQTYTQIVGRMDVQGDVITLNPTAGKYKASDNCVASHNFTRAMTADEVASKQNEQWGWEFAVNDLDGKTYLMLGGVGSGQAYHFKPAQ